MITSMLELRMIKNILRLSVCIALVAPSASQASIAVSSHVCEIKAAVDLVDIRKEKVLMPLMGPDKYQVRKYTDVSLTLISAKLVEEHFMGECSVETLPKIYQLRDDGLFQKKPKEGQCIKAKTQFSGADTIVGQWLYDVEILTESECVTVDNE